MELTSKQLLFSCGPVCAGLMEGEVPCHHPCSSGIVNDSANMM